MPCVDGSAPVDTVAWPGPVSVHSAPYQASKRAAPRAARPPKSGWPAHSSASRSALPSWSTTTTTASRGFGAGAAARATVSNHAPDHDALPAGAAAWRVTMAPVTISSAA